MNYVKYPYDRAAMYERLRQIRPHNFETPQEFESRFDAASKKLAAEAFAVGQADFGADQIRD